MRAGHRDVRRVGVEVGLDDDHLGAGFDQTDHRGRDGLGSADGDQHLVLRVELLAVPAVAAGRRSPPQFGDAQPGRVLVDAVGDRLPGRLQHGRRPVLIGETLAQVHRPDLGDADILAKMLTLKGRRRSTVIAGGSVDPAGCEANVTPGVDGEDSFTPDQMAAGWRPAGILN